jgi:ABC-type transporter Mla MlaB component
MGDARFERLGVAVDVDRVGVSRIGATCFAAAAGAGALLDWQDGKQRRGDQAATINSPEKLLSRIRRRPCRCC